MKTQRTVFSASALWLTLTSPLLCLAQSKQSGPSPITRSQIRVSEVKPDMVNDWLALEKNQVNPALKRAGISTRTVLVNVYGDVNEYVSITPLNSHATLDGEDPLTHGLGKDGAAKLRASLYKCITAQRVYVSNRINDLSSPPDPKSPALVWVTVRYRTAPGKAPDYENYFKTDVAPIDAKAKAAGKIAGYSLSRRSLGADAADRVMVIYLNRFADLEAGSPMTQALGPDGAAKLAAKSAGFATLVEELVRRRVADLSF